MNFLFYSAVVQSIRFFCVPEIATGLEGIDEGREERELELRLLAAKRDLLLLSDKVSFSQPHSP